MTDTADRLQLAVALGMRAAAKADRTDDAAVTALMVVLGVIASLDEPHQNRVLDAIRELAK